MNDVFCMSLLSTTSEKRNFYKEIGLLLLGRILRYINRSLLKCLVAQFHIIYQINKNGYNC